MKRIIVVLAVSLAGCGGNDNAVPAPDSGADMGQDQGLDTTGVMDLSPEADVPPEPDATPDLPRDSERDPGIDAGLDAEPDTAPPIAQSIDLEIADASLDGGVLRDGCAWLAPGGSLTWVHDVGGVAGLDVEASTWRGEGATAAVNGDPVRLHHVWGQLRTVSVTAAEAPPEAGYGVDYAPRRALVTENRVELVAGGFVTVCRAALVPPSSPVADPLLPPASVPLPDTVVAVAPCGDDCDDGAAVTAVIANLDGPATVRFSGGTYHLRSPILVGRDDVALVGEGEETILRWDPTSPRDWGAAIEIRGGGAGAYEPLSRDVVPGDTALSVDGEFEAGQIVHLVADDHGEVPELCRGGRDVERVFRHHDFLARVVDVSPGGVVIDRPVPYPLPLSAQPRLALANLVRGVAVRDLTLVANCPEADELPPGSFGAAACANERVLQTSAVLTGWADAPEIRAVRARHFGRFGVHVERSLEARVVGGGMTKPSDYGGGGAGYGVHAIRASRTLVYGYEVVQGRHAVVIDFGSTESQVVASTLTDCSSYAVDIHGEASYDTLVLANTIERSNGSVTVGGGGRQVHCNDGPRHHFVGNSMRTGGFFNVVVTDYSSEVYLHHNTIDDSGYSMRIDSGSTDTYLERNALRNARAGHILAAGVAQGTNRIRLKDNVLDGAEEDWVTADPGIEVIYE